MPLPDLPSAFELHIVPDGTSPWDAAMSQANDAAVDGHVFWRAQDTYFSFAIVLEPDADSDQAKEIQSVFQLALATAIGATIPPAVPVQTSPPADILVDGSLLTSIKSANEAGQNPGWAVIGVEFPIRGSDNEISLASIAGEVEPADVILMSLCRHLLSWVYRWQEEGIGPVHRHLDRLRLDKTADEPGPAA